MHRVILFPLINYYTDMKQIKRFDLLYFLFKYEKNDALETFNFLWPICKYAKSDNYKYFHFVPLIWYRKSPTSQYFSIQPFYYHWKSADEETYRFCWEFFVYKNQTGIKKSRNIIWKTFYWDRYANKDYETRLLYLLFANVKKDGNVERSLFPLYYYSKQSNGNKTLSLFFYFYNSVKRQIAGSNEFYQERRIFWFLRILSNKKALEKKGIKVKK